jgi:hypothetical protein
LDAPPKTIHNFAQALFPKEDWKCKLVKQI